MQAKLSNLDANFFDNFGSKVDSTKNDKLPFTLKAEMIPQEKKDKKLTNLQEKENKINYNKRKRVQSQDLGLRLIGKHVYAIQ